MKALIIINIQRDFLPGGKLPVSGGEDIGAIVNRLQPAFSLIVATQNWYPPQHQRFASNHPGKQPYDVIYLNGRPQTLWPDHCIQGSHGAAISNLLNDTEIAAIFRTGMHQETDSNSAFYDSERRYPTGLAGFLQERKVHEIYLAGLAGDYDIYYTAMDGLRLNFKTYIIQDASAPFDRSNFAAEMRVFETAGGQLITSSQLLNKRNASGSSNTGSNAALHRSSSSARRSNIDLL